MNKGPLNLAKSYNFVEKRPVIDEMRTLIDHTDYRTVANDAHVSTTTLRNLVLRQNREPADCHRQQSAGALRQTLGSGRPMTIAGKR